MSEEHVTEALTFAATWLFYAFIAVIAAVVVTTLYLWWKQDR